MFEEKTEYSDNSEEYERIIFEMFYHRVYKTAYFIIKDQYLAQDIVQETFMKAFQHIDKVQNGRKLGPWLGTIATRTAIDYIRKRKRCYDVPVEDFQIDTNLHRDKYSDDSVEDMVELAFLKKQIQANIAKLNEEQRQVLLLKYVYDMKDKDIADVLDINISTAKSRLHRGRLKLRGLLQNTLDIGNGDLL